MKIEHRHYFTIDNDGNKNYLTGIFNFSVNGMNMIYHINDGFIHHDDGPAIVCSDEHDNTVYYAYYQNGKLHYENGPALIDVKNNKEAYYLDGLEYSKEEFLKRMK